jgi:hypothetical protein
MDTEYGSFYNPSSSKTILQKVEFNSKDWGPSINQFPKETPIRVSFVWNVEDKCYLPNSNRFEPAIPILNTTVIGTIELQDLQTDWMDRPLVYFKLPYITENQQNALHLSIYSKMEDILSYLCQKLNYVTFIDDPRITTSFDDAKKMIDNLPHNTEKVIPLDIFMKMSEQTISNVYGKKIILIIVKWTGSPKAKGDWNTWKPNIFEINKESEGSFQLTKLKKIRGEDAIGFSFNYTYDNIGRFAEETWYEGTLKIKKSDLWHYLNGHIEYTVGIVTK